MGSQPARQRLGGGGFSKGVVTCPQAGDKDLGLTFNSRFGVYDRHRRAAIIHKHFLPAFVDLAHGEVVLAFPLPVAAAELGVAKRPVLLVKPFLPQQRQGDPFALQVSVHLFKIHWRGRDLGRFAFSQ